MKLTDAVIGGHELGRIYISEWTIGVFIIDIVVGWSIPAAIARPLQSQRAGGRYLVTARGNERRAIFRDDRDRRQFLKLLG